MSVTQKGSADPDNQERDQRNQGSRQDMGKDKRMMKRKKMLLQRMMKRKKMLLHWNWMMIWMKRKAR